MLAGYEYIALRYRLAQFSQWHLSEGATVVIDQVGGDPAANGTGYS
jgi:hypothetical protein